MSPGTRKILFGLVIALDLVFFGAWIASEESARVRGVEVRLPVEGFDPRDLLSGHFVRFRLAAEREAAEVEPSASEYCLEEREGRHHVSRVRDSDCPLYLRAVQESPVRFGVDRFYIDERQAEAAAVVRAGPDTYLRARVTRDGRVHPVDLVIEGRSFAPGR